jgi:predicted PurR-regulated permease PerM
MEKKYVVEISHRTIIFTFFFILSMFVLWQIRSILFSLLIAFIIMSALKPLVDRLVNRGIPRLISSIVVFFIFIVSFVFLVFLALPPLINETILLIKNLPYYINLDYIKLVFPDQNLNFDFSFLSQQLVGITNSFFQILKTFFSNLVFLVSTLFFSYYFILEEDVIKKLVIRFTDEKNASFISGLFEKVEKRLGSWFWGEILLMSIVGIFTYIGLMLLGMPYALPLAVLAGLLEIVPNFGPTISAIPALIIGLSRSPFLFFANLSLYFIVQQLENNLIVPLVMKKAVNLNPLVTLLGLLIGGNIAGIMGVLLAVPITLIIETILVELTNKRNQTSSNNFK